MKTTSAVQAPQVKSLFSLIKFLQKQGCIVSASGHLEMPFKVTTKSLARSIEDVMLDNAIKLERWLHKQNFNVRKGDLGIDKTVTVSAVTPAGSLDVCKLVAVKTGGWQLKPTTNYKKAKRAKRSTRTTVRTGRRANVTIH